MFWAVASAFNLTPSSICLTPKNKIDHQSDSDTGLPSTVSKNLFFPEIKKPIPDVAIVIDMKIILSMYRMLFVTESKCNYYSIF